MMMAGIGHNAPPTPMEVVASEYDATLMEAANWADGEPVTNEAQMEAVDQIIASLRSYGTALTKAGKEHTDPLHKAWKAAVAEVKVYTDDADRIKAALVATVAPFKAQLAAEKEAARQAEWQRVREAERAAEEAERKASAADLEAQREVAIAQEAAMEARKAASAAQKDTVKGMRTVTHYEVTDYSDLLRWMNKHARAELEAAAAEYVRRVHKDGTPRPGVRVWQTKEAY